MQCSSKCVHKFSLIQLAVTNINAHSFHFIGSSESTNRIVAKAFQENLELQCTLPLNMPGFLHLAWYLCPTIAQCRSNWDRYRIAQIINKTIALVDFPEKFELNVYGTLNILKVQPEYDGKALLCKAMFHRIGVRENVALMEISKEQPKIIMKSPRRFLVVKEMPLQLDCKVIGFPPPRVIWLRDKQVLKNVTNDGATSLVLRNVTNDDGGVYLCKTENQLGNDSYAVEVNVIDFQSSTLTNTTDNHGGRECDICSVTTYMLFTLLILAGGY